MASSIAMSRFSVLTYGVCLPLAVLIGYFLAPMDRASVALMLLIVGVLCVPMLMRWHHPMLVFSWNSMVALVVVQANLCMALTLIAFFFAVLNLAIGRRVLFFEAPGVARSLICVGIVVMLTARMRGGLGLASLGSSMVGGRRYLAIYMAIMCYFAIAARRISPEKAPLYVGLFWLSALVGLIGWVAALAGPGFDILMVIFSAGSELMGDRMYGDSVIAPQNGLFRLGDAGLMGTSVFCYLAARYGIRGIFDMSRPWRFLLFCLSLFGVAVCGYRTFLLAFAMTFFVVFLLEGLFRLRYVVILGFVMAVIAVTLVPFARRLPPSMQRTLSMLPVEIDPIVRESADGSSDWRVLMWKELLPQIPRYFFKGKGLGIDPGEYFDAAVASQSGTAISAERALVAGDYHNGPLSVVISFGIFGVAAFAWFLSASVRVLYRNYRYGDPALKNINTLLFAYFLVRIFGFLFVFGSFHSDMIGFCGVVGLSVCMNGVAAPQAPVEPELELIEEGELIEA